MLRAAIKSQFRISNSFDRLLPHAFQEDGNTVFRESFAPSYLSQLPAGSRIYDVGSGKHPLLSAEEKQRMGARVVGLDIDAGELARAPAGTYDEEICTDVTLYRGNSDGDLVICQALLEHVAGIEHAFYAMASTLKPGGLAILFVPSRNAVFARLNLVLPENLKRKILFAVFPHSRQGQGFKSYYDRCTPRDFRNLARQVGLDVVELRPFYNSGYFTFFAPLHVLWRAWIMAFKALAKEQAAETFCMALRKPHTTAPVASTQAVPVHQIGLPSGSSVMSK